MFKEDKKNMTKPADQEDLKEGYRDESSNSSNAESDFENDSTDQQDRNSTEIAEHDRGLLSEEDEREKLLTAGGARRDPPRGFFGRRQQNEKSVTIDLNKRKARRSHRTQKNKKRSGKDGEGGLLYEMEEGGRTYDSSSQASSSSAELDKTNSTHSSMLKVYQMCLVTGKC